MYTASDLRKGLKVEIEGQPYFITEFNFVKPGKGQAVYNCKLKNMISGSTLTRAYRSDDKIDQPHLEEKNLRYSYAEGEDFVFIDEDYAQIHISGKVLGQNRFFLIEDIPVDVLFHNNQPIEVTLPNFVEKKIIHTEPGARGNTANNVLKPATVEGGYELQVPLFVNLNDVIRIDTRTGEYADRVAKR
jgi:elongation factor P